MKALIHHRLTRMGGLETRLMNYMHYLVDAGEEVTIVCAKVDKDIVLPPGVYIKQIKNKIVPKIFRNYYFNQRLKRVFNPKDYDFVLSLGRTSHQDAVLAAGNHKGYLRALGKNYQSLDDRLQIHLDAISFKETPRILAASTMMKEELIALYGVSPNKIEILYPPLNTANFYAPPSAEARTAAQQQIGVDTSKTTFAFISSGHSRKGLPLLLEIFSQLKNKPYELLIAGHPAVTTSLPNVRYIGFLTDTRPLYWAADYTIHPALYEPFGQIISESLACGTPVLVSHMVGAKELVKKDYGIIVNSLKAADWIDTLESIEKNEFTIPTDFGTRYSLDLESHMKVILGE